MLRSWSGILIVLVLAVIQPVMTSDAPAGTVSPRAAIALPATFVPLLGRTSSADAGQIPAMPNAGLRLRVPAPPRPCGEAARLELAFGGATPPSTPLLCLLRVYLI